MTLEEKLVGVFKDTFDIADADGSLSQENCEKWDSMGHLNLIVELETEFDVSFEPEEIADIKSFGDVLACLRSKGAE